MFSKIDELIVRTAIVVGETWWFLQRVYVYGTLFLVSAFALFFIGLAILALLH